MRGSASGNTIGPVIEALEQRTMASASPSLQGQRAFLTHTFLTVDSGTVGQAITFDVTVFSSDLPLGEVELRFHGKVFQDLDLASSVYSDVRFQTTVPGGQESEATYTIPAGIDGAEMFGVGPHLVRAQYVGTEGFFYSSSAVAEFRVRKPQFVPQPSGVGTETLAAGSGPALKPGETATIEYNAYLAGTYRMFSTTEMQTADTTSFIVGADPEQVIPGLDAGVVGMQAGETRAISIPYELGYGKQGAKHLVPPRTNLVYPVTLDSIS